MVVRGWVGMVAHPHVVMQKAAEGEERKKKTRVWKLGLSKATGSPV